jgi:hypothetical protein
MTTRTEDKWMASKETVLIGPATFRDLLAGQLRTIYSWLPEWAWGDAFIRDTYPLLRAEAVNKTEDGSADFLTRLRGTTDAVTAVGLMRRYVSGESLEENVP